MREIRRGNRRRRRAGSHDEARRFGATAHSYDASIIFPPPKKKVPVQNLPAITRSPAGKVVDGGLRVCGFNPTASQAAPAMPEKKEKKRFPSAPR